MSKDRGVRICDRIDDAPGLFPRIEPKAAVHACDHEVEAREHIVGIIQRAIRQNIQLDPFEDMKRSAELFLQSIDRSVLRGDLRDREPACVMRRFGVIGHPEILKASRSSLFRHFGKRVHAVRRLRMSVQDSTNVAVVYQIRDSAAFSQIDFVAAFPQLRRNELQPEPAVYILFTRAREELPCPPKASRVQLITLLFCELSKH